MRVLYLYNKGLITPDFAMSLIMMDIELDIIEGYECSYVIDDELCQNKIHKAIIEKKLELGKDKPYDYVISFNFIPSAAYVCDRLGIEYISWMYDNWQPSLYSDALKLSCNRIFVFDSYEYQYLKSLNIAHAYWLPLAVNNDRLDEFDFTSEDKEKYFCDISFSGSLYSSKGRNGYILMRSYLDDETKEHLDSIISETAGNWTDGNAWYEKTKSIDFKKFPKIDFADDREKCTLDDNIYYATMCFAREISRLDRTMILNELSQKFNIRLYTFEQQLDSLFNSVDIRPGVNYLDEIPKVHFNSRINLNITPRSNFMGIPLRVFDIMGSGGFLMTNKQKDMDDCFIDGIDYVSFDSIKDLKEKADYYLNHEKERIKILVNGYRKVTKYHTYQKRISQMFKCLTD